MILGTVNAAILFNTHASDYFPFRQEEEVEEVVE